MKYLFAIILFFFLSLSWAQNFSIPNKWIRTTLNQNITIKDSVFIKSNIKNFSFYNSPATNEFIQGIFRDNIQGKPIIKSNKNYISIDYSNENVSEFFYIFEDKIIFTYRVNIGSDEETVVYILKTKKIISFRFWTAKIVDGNIYFEADSYNKGHVIDRGIMPINKIF